MDLYRINVDLFNKLSLAIAIIRNTPSGIKPDVFTRILAKRLFPKIQHSNHLVSVVDEHLILRQQDLLSRLNSFSSTFSSSISRMDCSTASNENDDLDKNSINEYEYGEFAEKVSQLKDRKYQIKVNEIEFLLNTLMKWITTTIDTNRRTLPIDACLYTIQIITSHLKTDNNKPYHIVLDILSIIDRFLDFLLDVLGHIADSHVDYLHQMIISLASSNSCVSRILDKLCVRLRQHGENLENFDNYNHQFASSISLIDPIDRLFNILHEIIHNRSIFQRRLSQRSIDRLFTFIHQVSSLLEGKPNHFHVFKLEGQLQAANYNRTQSTIQTFQSYTSSSSSDHSQCQQQTHHTKKTLELTSKINCLDYSMSQNSQSSQCF